MINLPQLPTDNFYKFLTISGVAIMIFSFYSLTKRTDDMLSAHETWNKETIGILQRGIQAAYKKTELKYYTQAKLFTSYSKRVDSIGRSIDSDTTINPALLQLIIDRLTHVDTTVIQIQLRIQTIIDDLDSSIPIVVTNKEEYENHSLRFRKTLDSETPFWAPLISGFIVFIVGIAFWYKDQSIQDLILKNQLRKKESPPKY